MRVFTKSGLQIAHNFERIVHGGRGDYIEISQKDIRPVSIYIPDNQEWRTYKGYDKKVYYWEYRSNDVSNIMIYFQRKLVNYADYKIGFYYVDPSDVVLKE